MMKLSDMLREWREREGLSQYGAAKELGLSRLTYRTWELGVAQPSIEHLLLLSEKFGKSVPEILGALGFDAYAHLDVCPTCKGTGRRKSA